jgi:hypothetical protein
MPRIVAAAGALALGGLLSPAAYAGKAECASAYVDAQRLMKGGSLKKARERLRICAADDCLPAVKKDCVTWLDEVNTNMASVVVVARGRDRNETMNVRVFVDDELVAEKLDARGIDVEPGTHKFRFELEGNPPLHQEVLLRQGQKNKVVEVSWYEDRGSSPTGGAAGATSGSSAGGGSTHDSTTARPPQALPILPIVLGGVGLVAAGTGVAFWLMSEGKKSDLEEARCAPACSSDDVDAIKTNRVVGDILVGVGVVAIAVGVVLYVTQPKAPATRTGLQLQLHGTSGGASLAF